MPGSCVFCRIIAGEIPGQFVHQDELVVAFRDIRPVAPVHVLVVPREHIENVALLTPSDRAVSARLLEVAAAVAHREGLAEGGYRITINTGSDSGSEVAHLHLHVIGGRRLRSIG